MQSRISRSRSSRRALMRRAMALGLSTPAIAAMLAACGGDDDDEADVDPTATEAAAAAPTATTAAAEPTATGAPPGGVTPAQDQTLIYAQSAESRSIDPANGFESNSLHVIRAAYEGLVSHVPGSTDIRPALAKEWEISDDAQTFTFTLRDGVTFSDGTPVDAEAVKKSYDRVVAMDLGPASLLQDVDVVNVVDAATVEIVLTQPHAFFMSYVPKIGIVSPTAWESNDKDGDFGAAYLEQNTVGTGPFVLTDFRPEEQKTMERNSSYWANWDGPHIERIIFQIVPESATRRQMIEAGETHYVGRMTPEDLAALREVDGVNVEISENFEIDIITLNTTKAPLDDVRVRRAMQLAFDYEGFRDSVLLGNGRIPTGPIAPGYTSYNSALEPFKQDLDAAKALLQEAGVTEATMEKNYVEGLAEEQQSGLILQDALNQLGLNLELKPLPWASMFKIAGNQEEAMHMSNLLMATFTADPTFTLNQNYGCAFAGEPYNWSWYCNEDVQSLIDKAKRTLDLDDSISLLQEAQQIIIDDAPAIFYANPFAVEATSSKVQNYAWNPVDYYWQVDWYNVWLSE